MLRKGILLLLLATIGLFSGEQAFAAKRKSAKHKTHHTSSKKSKRSSKKNKYVAKGKGKKSKKHSRSHMDDVATVQVEKVESSRTAAKQMIALNTEKARIADSLNKSTITNSIKDDKEGYFASLFASKNKAASFQTLEGTAAVFKSISGWDDKKFYVLTNLLPVGTIVRITTPDLKSICAKVINALPEVGNSVQYRLNDAAAAILGINNKTFPVSVTY